MYLIKKFIFGTVHTMLMMVMIINMIIIAVMMIITAILILPPQLLISNMQEDAMADSNADETTYWERGKARRCFSLCETWKMQNSFTNHDRITRMKHNSYTTVYSCLCCEDICFDPCAWSRMFYYTTLLHCNNLHILISFEFS